MSATATPAQDYDGYVAQAELKYFLQHGGSYRLRAGRRLVASPRASSADFSNSYLGAFYVRDRGYMKLRLLHGQACSLRRSRADSPATAIRAISEAQGSFEQSRIDARLFGEYRLSDIVGLNTTILYDQAIGGDDIIVTADDPATGADESEIDNLEYSRFQAYIGMRVFW